MAPKEQRQSRHQSGRYASKVMTALNRFTEGLSTEAINPLKSKYGKAYDHLISGDASRYREETDDAIRFYEAALALRPDFTEVYLGLAKCLRRKGDMLGAIRQLAKGIAQNAFHADLYLEIAKCYAEEGYIKKAVHHYERMIKLCPKTIEGRFGLALLVETGQDAGYAIRLYQEILGMEPDFLPAYNNLGSIYMRLGDYDQAESLFRSLVEKAPEFTRGHLGLAFSLDKAEKWGSAIDSYQQVLRMRPSTRNADFIEKRIIQLNIELGRYKTRNQTLLVRVK